MDNNQTIKRFFLHCGIWHQLIATCVYDCMGHVQSYTLDEEIDHCDEDDNERPQERKEKNRNMERILL